MPNDTTKPRLGINLRKAAAGRTILENPGISTKKALIKAGYAPGTARTPKDKGLDAEACVAEAVKADPLLDPGKLLSRARRALYKKLGDEQTIATARLGELARVVDVTEKYYSGHGDEGLSARGFVDRLEFLRDLHAELARRKQLDSPESD